MQSEDERAALGELRVQVGSISGEILMAKLLKQASLPRRVPVNPRRRWVDTGIEVVKGQTLSFAAAGKWTDLWIGTDANGFPDNPAEFLGRRRYPQFYWLALLGSVGRGGEEVFLIGDGKAKSYTFEGSGRLYVLANDNKSWLAYINNWGEMTLTISAVPGGPS